MLVTILCPNPDCGASYSIAEETLGRIGRCKECGTTFPLIPATRFDELPSGVDSESEVAPLQWAEPAQPATFGRYRILKTLGRGGMGSVYLAHDSQLDREVALKVPHPETARRPEVRERFLREARAAAKLHHPSFCPIFDIGEVEGSPYLTMAFIEGRTLAESIERGQPWPPGRAAEVILRLAVALGEAHRRGIIHRDLKPSNIMVGASGNLVLMDFGLARRVDTSDPTFTAAGSVLGTPAYMPPEQAEGDLKAIGPRSDIYSLGVILYEIMTGRRPFEGPPARVLAMILLMEPDRPSVHLASIDPGLERICLRAMAKKPEDRFGSMDELAGALTDWAIEQRERESGRASQAPPEGRDAGPGLARPGGPSTVLHLSASHLMGKPDEPRTPAPKSTPQRPASATSPDSSPKPVMYEVKVARGVDSAGDSALDASLGDDSAEEIRRANLNREMGARSLGYLFYILSELGTTFSMVMFAIEIWPKDTSKQSEPILMVLGVVIPLFLFPSIFFGVVGYGLKRLRSWALWSSVILDSTFLLGFSLFGLVLTLTSPVLGLISLLVVGASGGSILSFLLSSRTRFVFSEQYRGIVRRTPRIGVKTHWVITIGFWSLFVIILLFMAVTIVYRKS